MGKNTDNTNLNLNTRRLKKRFEPFALLWLLLIPLGIILPRVFSLRPDLVEAVYSQKVYPFISNVTGYIVSLAPCSLAELLVYAAILGVALLILIQLIRFIFRRIHILSLVKLVVALCIAAGILLNGFYLMWGFNYSRPKLSELMGLNVVERRPEELEKLCAHLAEKANELRSRVSENESGIFILKDGYRPGFNKLPEAFDALGRKYPLFARNVFAAKGVIASKGMSYAGIAGVFFPFTAEANVNTDQPALLLLSSAAHENAHYLGIAREDEANFVSYIACSYSKDADIAYSGTMLALINASNKLHEADAELYYEIYNSYSEGIKRDIADYNRYWDSYEGPVEETVTRVNDNYLKFNQQQAGVRSYGEMVDLLLAYYYK